MRMTRLVVLMLWAMTLALGVLAGQGPGAEPVGTLDLQAYAAELARWSTSAGRLREHPEEAVPLRKQLPDHWSVVVQQQTFNVSTQWMGSSLDCLSANPKLASGISQEITVRLNSMAQDAQDLAKRGAPTSSQARGKLDDILKRSEFRSVHATVERETFWDMLSDWFWIFINKLLSRASGRPIVTRVLLWGVVIALGLVFLGWLIYSLANVSFSDLSFRRQQSPEKAAGPPEPGTNGCKTLGPPPPAATIVMLSESSTARPCAALEMPARGKWTRREPIASMCGCCQPIPCSVRRCWPSQPASSVSGTATHGPPQRIMRRS